MGGFKESSSAYRYCRHCMGTKEETKTEVYTVFCYGTVPFSMHQSFSQFDEAYYTLRTLENHLNHCAWIQEDPTGELSKEYGVNNRSTLLDLGHFDMCSGTLLPDIMHDLLEGVIQHLLPLLLTYCIEEKRYFTLSTLNEKISGIELGYMEDNRPSTIDNYKNVHLRQNGKKMVTNASQ